MKRMVLMAYALVAASFMPPALLAETNDVAMDQVVVSAKAHALFANPDALSISAINGDSYRFSEEKAAKAKALLAEARHDRLELRDGHHIAFAVAKPADATKAVMIIPGLKENYSRYVELIYDFYQSGYAVYIADLRGMGASDRDPELASRQMVYVDDFRTYTLDASEFIERVIKPEMGEKDLFLFAHSTGGLVAIRLLWTMPVFRAAVLSSPLIDTKRAWWQTEMIVKIFTDGKGIIGGRAKDYARGFHDVPWAPQAFEDQGSARDPKRFAMINAYLEESPDLIMAGPTNAWVNASLREYKILRQQKFAKAIKTPILIFQAPQDNLVKLKPQDTFCDEAPACTLLRLPKAWHTINLEPDENRVFAIRSTAAFFDFYHH